MDRRHCSGRPPTATTAENEEVVKDLICSLEENPGSHKSPRKTEKHTGISRSSVRRMVKRKGLKQFKRLKTQRISEGTRERRTERAGALAERIGMNSRNI